MERGNRQTRSVPAQFETRQDDSSGELFIEGYFSVFDSVYELWPGATESVEKGAFADTLDRDVRALIDHKTRLVLGRTKAGTLELKEDEHGLFGRIKVNLNDTDAMNLYARVQRGDVDQCSFGFDIVDEESKTNGNETHWTIKSITLYEVSVVTFPAYEETEVAARKRDYEEIQRLKRNAWEHEMKQRVKGENKDGIKGNHEEKKA